MRILLAANLALLCLVGALFIPAAYALGPNEVILTAKQVVAGNTPSSLSEQTFTYCLTPEDVGNPMPVGSGPAGYVFSIAGTDEAQIGPMTFNVPGVYTYDLRCVPTPLAYNTFDLHFYTIEIYVLYDLSAVTVVYHSGIFKSPEIEFVHSYLLLASDPAIMVDPPVQKTVQGNPATNAVFRFQLRAEVATNPMPDGSANGVKTMEIVGSGSEEFGTWAYTEEGTYRYTVVELDDGIANYSYDKTVYTITDVVTTVGGQLVVSRTVTGSMGGQSSSLAFTNTYTAPAGPSTPGGAPKTGDHTNPLFWVVLLAASGGFQLFLIWKRRREREE
ncbi:MAG: hypothetical protein FWE65_00630 [Eggerthellaceae bacterium]|nr:hypothetical protein [Eggerthellaceae bacterium]